MHICPGIVSPILSVLKKIHNINYICTGITIARLRNGLVLSELRDRTTGHNAEPTATDYLVAFVLH